MVGEEGATVHLYSRLEFRCRDCLKEEPAENMRPKPKATSIALSFGSLVCSISDAWLVRGRLVLPPELNKSTNDPLKPGLARQFKVVPLDWSGGYLNRPPKVGPD